MTEDTRNVRDAFSSVDTKDPRTRRSGDTLPNLERIAYEATISEMWDENARLRASLALYTHGSPPAPAALVTFTAGAVSMALIGALFFALFLWITRPV